MKNNHGFSNILVILTVLVLLGVGGYFLFNKLNQKSEILKPEDEISLIVDSVKLEIENNKPKNFKSIEKDENGYLWWITDNGYSIITNSSPTTYVRLNTNWDMEKDSRGPIASDFIELNKIVKDKVRNKGFKLNELNSNKEIKTDMDSINYIYDYIQAYEKAGIKCVAAAN